MWVVVWCVEGAVVRVRTLVRPHTTCSPCSRACTPVLSIVWLKCCFCPWACTPGTLVWTANLKNVLNHFPKNGAQRLAATVHARPNVTFPLSFTLSASPHEVHTWNNVGCYFICQMQYRGSHRQGNITPLTARKLTCKYVWFQQLYHAIWHSTAICHLYFSIRASYCLHFQNSSNHSISLQSGCITVWRLWFDSRIRAAK